MNMAKNKPTETCPHCGQPMHRWQPPLEANWGVHPQFVCFNDECPYYVQGWEWMRNHYDQNVSYRYRYDPVSGERGPLPAWSSQAHRDRIVDDQE